MTERKRDFFIQGKSIALKVLSEQDIEESNWYDWFNNEETTMYMQKHYYPNTKIEQMDYWKNIIKGANDKIQLGICDVKGGPIQGCVSLSSINYINRTAEIAMIIGEKSGRNFGNFIEATKLMLNHGFYSLNLNRIYGGTLIKEVANAYKRILGFEIEGISRSHVYKNGLYHDVYMIGLMKSDYEAKLKINNIGEKNEK